MEHPPHQSQETIINNSKSKLKIQPKSPLKEARLDLKSLRKREITLESENDEESEPEPFIKTNYSQVANKSRKVPGPIGGLTEGKFPLSPDSKLDVDDEQTKSRSILIQSKLKLKEKSLASANEDWIKPSWVTMLNDLSLPPFGGNYFWNTIL